MSEQTEYWRDIKKYSQLKKESNRISSTKHLREAGIEFDSRNDGLHLMIKHQKGIIHFWPSTGKFNGIIEGRGVFNLIKAIKEN